MFSAENVAELPSSLFCSIFLTILAPFKIFQQALNYTLEELADAFLNLAAGKIGLEMGLGP